MRILVTGSRELNDKALVIRTIKNHSVPPLTIIVDDCPTGADEFARSIDTDLEVHHTDWKTHGRSAGPRRNQEMINSGVDLCFAFYRQGAGNRGTKDCVRRARKSGIPVIERTESDSLTRHGVRMMSMVLKACRKGGPLECPGAEADECLFEVQQESPAKDDLRPDQGMARCANPARLTRHPWRGVVARPAAPRA